MVRDLDLDYTMLIKHVCSILIGLFLIFNLHTIQITNLNVAELNDTVLFK